MEDNHIKIELGKRVKLTGDWFIVAEHSHNYDKEVTIGDNPHWTLCTVRIRVPVADLEEVEDIDGDGNE